MRRINPIHGLTLLFLIGLILLVLFFRDQIPLWRSLLWRYALGAGVLLVLKWCSDRGVMGRVGKFINDFSPILYLILTYQSLGDLIQYLHPDVDPQLIRIDFFLFGVHPTVWLERWIVPWLTGVLSVAYLSYFFLPARLVHTLYLKNPRRDFELAVFVLLLVWYLSFFGYLLFPAIGPRYTLAHLQSVPLNGGFITDFVSHLIDFVEGNHRDCMPSGHVAIALIVLFLSYHYARRLFYLFCPIVGALILSTVYLRYHYVIDLFAGALLAAGCSLIGPRLYRWWATGGGQEKREA
ncbi:MAG: phosphatase PAP2 family protein [Deltaproteobacteria bacterium]|nr:phosphatase PAP2 family protein [Deltaproteobacteria bacterium]